MRLHACTCPVKWMDRGGPDGGITLGSEGNWLIVINESTTKICEEGTFVDGRYVREKVARDREWVVSEQWQTHGCQDHWSLVHWTYL